MLEPSIRQGIWFPIPEDFTEAQTRSFWFSTAHQVFVGEQAAEIVWTYFIGPIHLGRGSHIANAAYAVHPSRFGQGFGLAMVQHSLATAREQGYRAMQYTAVLSSNERAVKLYKKAGFTVLTPIPEGYRHPTLGFVDTLVMYQKL